MSQTTRSRHGIKKLSPFATYVTTMKGFMSVCILYLPFNFFLGGITFSFTTFIIAGILSLQSVHLLLEVRAETGYRSFGEMAANIFGPKYLHLINAILIGCQSTFCLSFIYLIIEVFHNFFLQVLEKDVNRIYFGIFVFVIMASLAMVRKIQVFASTHQIALTIIFFTVFVTCYYGITEVVHTGDRVGEMEKVIGNEFYNTFGFAIFAYEGIGTVLPIQDITRNPEEYPKIVNQVVLTLMILFMGFGFACSNFFGSDVSHVTTVLALYPNSWFAWTVKFLFCVNLFFSYPLLLYPITLTIESYLYSGWPKSRKRHWFKNLTRALEVLTTVVITLVIGQKI